MHNKIKTLEELVDTVLANFKELEKENALLKKQIESLTAEKNRISGESEKLSGVDEWKRNIRKKLEKLCLKIERINGK
ncbi:MAG: hypothetical protein HY746_09630 [Elusimicrobia bacterium]|nr:hypothetical protein [Elusimicrobiota bacterium]